MENTNEIEDFYVEVNDSSQPKEEAVLEESSAEATESEETTESEKTTKDENVVDADKSTNLINTLIERIESLRQQNELLQKKFDNKIAEDEHKAQLFDKMYNELQSYKTDLYAKILKPFVLSTITLLDDTNTFLGKLAENESALAEKYLRSLPDDLVDILEANGVTLYEDDVDIFNPRTQRVVKKVPTEKPEFDNSIAKRVRKGYSWNGANLKPELVWIYKYGQDSSARKGNQ